MNTSPEKIFSEYHSAKSFKTSLGTRGLDSQTALNERFFAGDQWYGVSCPSDRPLVRHNVIKRIGDYKMSQLASTGVSVAYSAEGVPDTLALRKEIAKEKQTLAQSNSSLYSPINSKNEIGLMISALNSYRSTVASRVGLSALLDSALRNAFVSGLGIIYTYFDPCARTGLFADKIGGTQILGDIACEVIKAENIYFADPSCTKLQSQPYIILAERKPLGDILAEAKLYSKREFPEITEEQAKEKTLLLTKLFKRRMPDNTTKVYAVKVCERFTVREEWDIGVRIYPLSIFSWEPRDNNIYGDSEITHLIPNQIAINRMLTASVWSAMTTGMPLMLVNGELVPENITNEPGQIIRVWGNSEELDSAIRYINPPDFSSGYNQSVEQLISNTLSQSGATDAALGDTEAHNTSAIIELRDASSQPLVLLKNRYYRFIEDISLIWAEFFVTMYGKRSLKIKDENGTWYFPFDASRYRNLVISAAAQANQSVSRRESEAAALLAKLYDKGAITAAQYIRRLPSGIIPDSQQLIEQLEATKYEGN